MPRLYDALSFGVKGWSIRGLLEVHLDVSNSCLQEYLSMVKSAYVCSIEAVNGCRRQPAANPNYMLPQQTGRQWRNVFLHQMFLQT